MLIQIGSSDSKLGVDLQLLNLLRANKKVSTLKSIVTSECTALVTGHVNKRK